MDTLENKWNGLLNDMEYLSKKCNEQHLLLQQQVEPQFQHDSEENELTVEQQQFNHYLNLLYKVINKTAELINSNNSNNDDSISNIEEQHDAINVIYILKTF